MCYSTANALEVEIQPEVGSLSKLGKFLDQDCVEVIPKDEKSVYTLIVYDKDWQAVATMLAEVLVLAPG